jgi:hypothetical protein
MPDCRVLSLVPQTYKTSRSWGSIEDVLGQMFCSNNRIGAYKLLAISDSLEEPVTIDSEESYIQLLNKLIKLGDKKFRIYATRKKEDSKVKIAAQKSSNS